LTLGLPIVKRYLNGKLALMLSQFAERKFGLSRVPT